MEKMKQVDKFAQARAQAMQKLDMTDAFVTGVGELAVETEFGWVKVKFTAVKDAEFDAEQAQADFKWEQEDKARVKAEKAAQREADKALKAANKAKNAKVE